MSTTQHIYSIDTETNSLNTFDKNMTVWCVGYASQYGSECNRFDNDQIDTINDLVNRGNKLVFHNASFDVPVLRKKGANIAPGQYEDTLLMAYCLYPGESLSLDSLAEQFLGKKKYPKPNFNAYTEEMRVYCEQDTLLTYELYWELLKELKAWPSAYDFYYEVELPYAEKIIEMQTAGCKIDWNAYHDYVDIEKKEVDQTYSKFFTFKEVRIGFNLSKTDQKKSGVRENNLIGIKPKAKFNPNSSEHIADALERRGHKLTKTSKGNRKTSKDALNNLAADEFIDTLRYYRKHTIINSTFLPALMNNEFNGRVYGDFNQASVRTGRLSSSNPNLQNIPSRDERGAAMRRMFTAEEGNILLAGDLNRIELVVLGFYLEYVLGYPDLSNRIKTGEDVHQSNTDEWSSLSGVTLERKRCKNGQFALIYGCGVNKFANTVGIPVEAAKRIFERSEIIAAIHELRDILVAEAVDNEGFLSNFFGRNLYIPEVLSKSGNIRATGDRLCLNYMIQGTAGDVFKVLQLDAQGVQILYSLIQLIVVHDECLYEMSFLNQSSTVDPSPTYAVAECRKALDNTFSSKDLLVVDDVWANIECNFYAGTNWWLAKIAEDVLEFDPAVLYYEPQVVCDSLSISMQELESVLQWNS